MTARLLTRDMFNFSKNVTVLACEGDTGTHVFMGSSGKLPAGNEVRQSITLIGQRTMLTVRTEPTFGLLVDRVGFSLLDEAMAETELHKLRYTGKAITSGAS